jgi:hypothetical protein
MTRRTHREQSWIMIEARRLAKFYGKRNAVDDVHRPAQASHRFPRPERRRQVHHHAHDSGLERPTSAGCSLSAARTRSTRPASPDLSSLPGTLKSTLSSYRRAAGDRLMTISTESGSTQGVRAVALKKSDLYSSLWTSWQPAVGRNVAK